VSRLRWGSDESTAALREKISARGIEANTANWPAFNPVMLQDCSRWIRRGCSTCRLGLIGNRGEGIETGGTAWGLFGTTDPQITRGCKSPPQDANDLTVFRFTVKEKQANQVAAGVIFSGRFRIAFPLGARQGLENHQSSRSSG